MKVRLQKYLADAGVASRRQCERIILEGRVTVNDRLIRVMGCTVDPPADRIAVDGTVVKPRRKLYLALHKPRGYVCSRRDPHHTRFVGSLLPKEWSNLYSVGRLDRDSEGLIFFTNDGEFCLRLTHPRYGVSKVYRVTVEGHIEPSLLRRLREGVMEQGELLRVTAARLLNANNTRSILELELCEGKNREIRRLLAAHQLAVQRLERIRIGRIRLGELPAGKWRTLTDTEIKSLLSSL